MAKTLTDKQLVDGKASIDCLSLTVIGVTLQTSSRITAGNMLEVTAHAM